MSAMKYVPNLLKLNLQLYFACFEVDVYKTADSRCSLETVPETLQIPVKEFYCWSHYFCRNDRNDDDKHDKREDGSEECP